MDLQEALRAAAAEVEAAIDDLLPVPEGSEARLLEAMRYSTLGGGKRLRPFLVIESARLFGVEGASAMRTACALEMIHCYSLVHDDLPAMDDDDLRRGRPTCHKAFDEATAILAGDGLLTYAFDVVADPATHNDSGVRANLVLALARAAGRATRPRSASAPARTPNAARRRLSVCSGSTPRARVATSSSTRPSQPCATQGWATPPTFSPRRRILSLRAEIRRRRCRQARAARRFLRHSEFCGRIRNWR